MWQQQPPIRTPQQSHLPIGAIPIHDEMKKLILASLLLAPALTQAAMPCQWQSNWGFVKFITPSPYWNSVRVGLTKGQTGASTSGTFNLPLPPKDVGKLELFQQTMDLIKDANARGVMISIETTGDTCYKASPLPTIAFVTTQVVQITYPHGHGRPPNPEHP